MAKLQSSTFTEYHIFHHFPPLESSISHIYPCCGYIPNCPAPTAVRPGHCNYLAQYHLQRDRILSKKLNVYHKMSYFEEQLKLEVLTALLLRYQ
jgi:hypothetical protein